MAIFTTIESAPEYIMKGVGVLPNFSVPVDRAWAWTWLSGKAVVFENGYNVRFFTYDRLDTAGPITSLEPEVGKDFLQRSNNDPNLWVGFFGPLKTDLAVLSGMLLQKYMEDPYDIRYSSVCKFFGVSSETKISPSNVGILVGNEEIVNFLGGENVLRKGNITDSERRLWHGISVAPRLNRGVFISRYQI